MIEVTTYHHAGIEYVCAGDVETSAHEARAAAEKALSAGKRLADDMERIDGCCTWTVLPAESE